MLRGEQRRGEVMTEGWGALDRMRCDAMRARGTSNERLVFVTASRCARGKNTNGRATYFHRLSRFDFRNQGRARRGLVRASATIDAGAPEAAAGHAFKEIYPRVNPCRACRLDSTTKWRRGRC